MRLAGNVVLITGGGGGLGPASARELHAKGAHVVLYDMFEDKAKALCAELGERADFVVGDALDEADTQHAIEVASSCGPLRGVVGTAGGGTKGGRTINRDGSPHDLANFKEMIDINVVSTFNTLRLAAAHMATLDPIDDDGQRGAMVFTASIAGYEGQIGQIAYAMAKAAVIGMVTPAMRDLSVLGIRVNAIAPGTMNTPAWEGGNPEVKATLEGKVPFPRRFGKPSEFGELSAFLLENDYVNGQVVRLDGGIRFDPK
jgi:NAD(P)-dependent dehydrogenase (short-subunit alcohol dehydrogenase family)